jgi:hypothetical protein
VLGFAVAVAACGSSPAAPTPPPPQPPPANTPPVIRSIDVPIARTEIDRDVTVVADVSDAETAVDALIYTWSATAGQISGTGRTVVWRLPRGSAPTPVDVTVTLVVTESYQVLQNGVIVTLEHRVTMTSAPFRAHDSDAEVRTLVLTFLSDFVNNSVPAAQCVRNFSDSCPGKAQELDDVQNIRDNYIVMASAFSVQSVGFNGALTHADVVAPCMFRSFYKPKGWTEIATGECTLTAIYETNVWKLCTSLFLNGTVIIEVNGVRLLGVKPGFFVR